MVRSCPDSPAPPRLRVLKASWAVLLGVVFSALAARALSPLARMWILANVEQDGQHSVYNSALGGGNYGLPVELGDYDGDGKVDIVLAPMAAPGGNATRFESGEIYVYRGDQQLAGERDRAALPNPPPGVTVWGARRGDFFGTEIYTADVNGDGIQDLLMGSQNYDGLAGDRDSAGGVFILLGSSGLLAGNRVIDLAGPPADVITIAGAMPGDRLGIWVEAGDLDGDGFMDILMGADASPAEDANDPAFHRGLAVVIYGRAQLPQVIDLAQVQADPGVLPGVSFIRGKDREDHFGCTLHGRDLDGDGRAELIAASALNRLSASRNPDATHPAHSTGGGDGPDELRINAGEVKVFYSLPAGERLPPLVDLAQPLPPSLQGRVTTIYGAANGDFAGEELTSGDFNGDGLADLVVGALTGLTPAQITAGTAYVIYSQPGLAGTTIDLAPGAPAGFPPGLRVSTLYGLTKLDLLGDTLSAGDFDHDGIDDLAVGIPMHNVGEVADAGIVAIVYGRPDPWPESWAPQADELPPQLQLAFVIGREMSDLLSYSMEAADYDGDGYADIFPNAMRGDGMGNARAEAGEAYLVSGYKLSGTVLGLSAVLPPEGFVGGEIPVVLEGTGFTTTDDTRVFAGGVPVSEARVVNARRIEAVLPAGAAPCSIEIRVETRYGSTSLVHGFRYLGGDAFIRGDTNLSCAVDISDAIATVLGLFGGLPFACKDAADIDDDGLVNLTDAVRELEYLFLGTAPPAAPFPAPGLDPSDDELGCR